MAAKPPDSDLVAGWGFDDNRTGDAGGHYTIKRLRVVYHRVGRGNGDAATLFSPEMAG